MRRNREEAMLRAGLVGEAGGSVFDPRYWGNMFRKEKRKQKGQSLAGDQSPRSK